MATMNFELLKESANKEGLVKLGKDLYESKTGKGDSFAKFSANEVEAEEFFKSELLRLADITGMDGKFHLQKLSPDQKFNFFSLVGIVIDSIVPKLLEDELNQFADIQSVDFGDKIVYEVTSPDLFEVATIAKGNFEVYSQRIHRGKLSLQPKARAIKIQEEAVNVWSGRTNWATMINKVARSFATKVKTDMYNALVATYSTLATGNIYGVTGAFDQVKFNTITGHVEAGAGGSVPLCFGTKLALANILNASSTVSNNFMSQEMMNDYNRKGFLSNYQGTDLIAIPQAHNPNTDTFALANDQIIIVPTADQKIIKVGFEGEAIIKEESTGLVNQDMSVEYCYIKHYDVAILSASRYGIYKFS